MGRPDSRRFGGPRRVLPWVVVTWGACGGGGGGGTPADVQREVVVIIPATDVGYDLGPGQDREASDARPDREDGTVHPDTNPEREDADSGDVARDDAIPRGDGGSLPDAAKDILCVPDCSGRVCGSDGCGGSCGTCKANEVCQGGACLCVPNCTGRDCGPDGCGGTCKPGCATGVPCLDTGKCAQSGPCTKVEKTLQCTGEDSSSSANNGWPPNSDVLDQYSCDPALAHGPEKVYPFVPDQSGAITVTLQGAFSADPPAFLNLYLLAEEGEGCTSRSCIAVDHREVSADVEAGRTYWVVVDAVQNNTASYDLTMSCSWVPATSDP